MDFIDPSSEDALDDSEMVADMLVAVSEQSGANKHWNEEALAFLTGLAMHVKIKTTCPPERQNLRNAAAAHAPAREGRRTRRI